MKFEPIESAPPTFSEASFIGIVDGFRRLRNGAAAVTFVIEPEYVDSAYQLWGANNIVAVEVKAWEPDDDDFL